MKKQFNNFTEIERMIDFLNIKEVTTSRQKENGTREFKLPINDPYGDAIHVASYSTGYVRRTRTSGRSDWQLNKTKKEKRHVRILIDNEQDRLAYLISYCLKNYYINQANKLSNGEYIPKWKYENVKERYDVDQDLEVKVIVNGHRYNII